MNKSNFQLLAEELEQEVIHLAKEIQSKKELLERAPSPGEPGLIGPDYVTDFNPVSPNAGYIAGFGVGAAANATAIVQNPALISAVKGKILPDADPRVVKYKPYYSNNLATMMGLGLDMNTFNRAKEFMNQYAPPDGGVAEKDDPEESVALDWKRLNNAVSNYNTQKVKDSLAQSYLFRGDKTSNYEQGVSDQYQRFHLGKKAQKAVDDTVGHILGTPKKSTGKAVNAYVKNLSQAQKERMGNIWSQNPDQSGKIQFRK